MAALILLVDPNRGTRDATRALLSRRGYLVATADAFGTARELLCSVSPDLLIVDVARDVRQALAVADQSAADEPRRPVILTHTAHDPRVERAARRLGATFLVRPWADGAFLAHVASTLANHRWVRFPLRRWKRRRISDPVKVRAGSAEAYVVDVSYGGLRLAFREGVPAPPATFDIALSGAGVLLQAHRVWSHDAPTGAEVWCGLEFADPDSAAATTWRAFVDSIS